MIVGGNHVFERNWFFVLSLYLFIEFARLQDFLPIGFLKPGMLVIVLLCVFILFSGKTGRPVNAQIKCSLSFAILLILYIPISKNTYYSYHAAKSIFLCIPVLLSIIYLIDSNRKIVNLFWVFSIILFFNSIYSIFNFGRGPGGVVGDENDLCLFVVTFLPFTLFLLSQPGEKLKKIFLFLIVTLALGAVVVSSSRGGFVGLLMMTVVFWFFSKKKVIIALCAVCIAVFIFMYSGDGYVQEIATITDTGENTAKSRLLAWEAAWHMFLDNILGVGGGNFAMHFPDYQSSEFSRNMWGRLAHSLWFTLLPETGIVGTYIFLCIVWKNIKNLFFIRVPVSAPHKECDFISTGLSVALLASFAGFLTAASFISVLYYPHFWLLTAIIVSVYNVHGQLLIVNINTPKVV